MALLFFSVAFIVCFTMGTGILTSVVIRGEPTWYEDRQGAGLLDLRVQFALWGSIAFSAVVRFLTYVDQRIRLEGWAVELSLRDAGHALEKSLS